MSMKFTHEELTGLGWVPTVGHLEVNAARYHHAENSNLALHCDTGRVFNLHVTDLATLKAITPSPKPVAIETPHGKVGLWWHDAIKETVAEGISHGNRTFPRREVHAIDFHSEFLDFARAINRPTFAEVVAAAKAFVWSKEIPVKGMTIRVHPDGNLTRVTPDVSNDWWWALVKFHAARQPRTLAAGVSLCEEFIKKAKVSCCD